MDLARHGEEHTLSRDRTNPRASMSQPADRFLINAPSISLPRGGGAIRGIGEKFAANPVTGTGSMTVPIPVSEGRSGFGPRVSLQYDSGRGNGPFGLGWQLSLPSITRRTDKGLPRYFDEEESDIFVLSGAEDLVPTLEDQGGNWVPIAIPDRMIGADTFSIRRYRPRIENVFARIERWTNRETGVSHWRSISRDNVTTLYGLREDARIAAPEDPARIFCWLISESYDDKGNAILYRYKVEDKSKVSREEPSEKNRLSDDRFAQRYLKRIQYGNVVPRIGAEDLTNRKDWLFELVFDFGEHHTDIPTTAEIQTWPIRRDPFSSYRAAFEVRTYRLCRRVLMFHHFKEELGIDDCLVRSIAFSYDEGPVASFMVSASESGHVWQKNTNTYLSRSFPPITFEYTSVSIDETVHEVDAQGIENLPMGVDGSMYQWVDLDSEGLTGVLTEGADAWYFKRNIGDGTFGPLETVARRPSTAVLGAGQQQLIDLAGEGRLDLVDMEGPVAGFYARTANGDWENFRAFPARPNVDTRDPNLRFIDLTGNGHSDILISEDVAFTWYESLAKEGFAQAQRTRQTWDEEKGPRLVFADVVESIFLADLSGDGLVDLVRIRGNGGEVCYWPNLGYGRFGAKVTMGNAPVFDLPDRFNPKRLRLADIDGSGCTDLIYLGAEAISLYFNECGNSWSEPQRLTHFPRIDSLSSVTVVDLRGNGTACLVWSSPLAADATRPMRFIDITGNVKPHLLKVVENHMGAKTVVHYVASTKFYLEDRLAGRPWVTKLPFPVHVVDRVETQDLVSNTKLVTTYRYRHGYFDGVEREFRGFAYVEQRDAENVVGEFDLPPVVTKTWFHTGAYLEAGQLEAFFKDPANQEYFMGDSQALFLPDNDLQAVRIPSAPGPAILSAEVAREACLAFRGILRQETYTDDGSPQANLPYSVSERSYALLLIQGKAANRHAVFLPHPRETIDYHYERKADDPRISHSLTLDVDLYGNVRKSASIGYARRVPQFDEQKLTFATLTNSEYTNAVDEDDAYRTPLPSRSTTYELTAPALTGAAPLEFSIVDGLSNAATHLEYHEMATPEQTQTRPIEHVRTLYRADDLSALLPDGVVESMALPGESYKQAFTVGVLDGFSSKASRADLTILLLSREAGYQDLDNDGGLWLCSGKSFCSPDTADTATGLAFAKAHFFLPHRFQDPFGNDTAVEYESTCTLPSLTRDALGNEIRAEYDYRVLQPMLITDPNDNRSAARFDALGLLVGTAVMGKVAGSVEGDSFDTFEANLDPATVAAFFDADNPHPLAIGHLGTATSRIVYDLDRVPVCAASILRETHVSDLGEATEVQLKFVYSDGSGREAQSKAQVEPGPLDPNVTGSPTLDPRWVATGVKVYNNKGNVVREYESYFSETPRFVGIEQQGVSSTVFYDPVGRVVATLHPNHTYEKALFDAWKQTTWDVNDTLAPALVETGDPRTDPHTKELVAAYFTSQPGGWQTWYEQRIHGTMGVLEKTAAEKAAKHVNTPSVAHFDGLGRHFLSIADNADGETHETRIEFDIEGNQRSVMDALGRKIMTYRYGMLGNKIHQASMEAGARWMLDDVARNPLKRWDSRGHEFWAKYDSLHRPVGQFVRGSTTESDPRTLNQDVQFEKTGYGEGQTDAAKRNLRTRVFEHRNVTGVVTSDAYDFKGNQLHAGRDVLTDYKALADWSSAVVPAFESVLNTSTTYDALNRVRTHTSPDGSVTRQEYSAAGLLNAVSVTLRASTTATSIVTNIEYNAKGQRLQIEYGNDVETAYRYDPETFRLIKLTTTRVGFPSDQRIAQDLSYTYDPTGNITHIQDDADIQNVIYFNNKRVEPSNDYRYDAVYRLVEATGRESLGQVGGSPIPHSYNDFARVGFPHPSDGVAMGTYGETYVYDKVGNFKSMQHVGSDPVKPGWTRTYDYQEDSQIEPGARVSNRLTKTTIGSTSEPYSVGGDGYDAHGNMLRMPHLQDMRWDCFDHLYATRRQAVNTSDVDGDKHNGEINYYVYDSTGERVRKVTERGGKPMTERVYLGGFEIYREYDPQGAVVTLARNTLHLSDDRKRIALVELRVTGDDGSPNQLFRYQFGNHLGSVCLELDEHAQVISYEEYTSYGSTSYQAVNKALKAAAKRYRFTGKERDEETGFNYHSARYYAMWLGRWVSCDPAQLNANPYVYCSNCPCRLVDHNGEWEVDMHLFMVYWTGRMSGTSHSDALKAAKFSQLPDEPIRLVTDREATSTLSAPNLKSVYPAGSPFAALANMLHSLGHTRGDAEKLAKVGIGQQDLTLFGIGLHPIGDYLPHGNPTGKSTFGHAWKLTRGGAHSTPFSGIADKTYQDAELATATSVWFYQMWNLYQGKEAGIPLSGDLKAIRGFTAVKDNEEQRLSIITGWVDQQVRIRHMSDAEGEQMRSQLTEVWKLASEDKVLRTRRLGNEYSSEWSRVGGTVIRELSTDSLSKPVTSDMFSEKKMDLTLELMEIYTR